MRKSHRPYLLIILSAILMAFMSAHYIWHGDARNVIPWGILTIGSSLLAATKTQSWKFGAVFGFSVSYCFLWFDNTDPLSLHQFIQLFLIIPLPSLFGALCGALLSRLAFSIKRVARRTN
jgi:hypothetical protein